jgi:hypothetical protein
MVVNFTTMVVSSSQNSKITHNTLIIMCFSNRQGFWFVSFGGMRLRPFALGIFCLPGQSREKNHHEAV